MSRRGGAPVHNGSTTHELLADVAAVARRTRTSSAGSRGGWSSARAPWAAARSSAIRAAAKMQSVMNLKIKYRESFRPFAPSVWRSAWPTTSSSTGNSPYMLLVAPVQEEQRIAMTPEQTAACSGIDKLNVPRSRSAGGHPRRLLGAHSDRARGQPTRGSTRCLRRSRRRTGCPVLINTSFNVRGEPIVCTPEDAYRCFMRTEMDYLVLENFLLDKHEQPPWDEGRTGRTNSSSIDHAKSCVCRLTAELRKFGLLISAIDRVYSVCCCRGCAIDRCRCGRFMSGCRSLCWRRCCPLRCARCTSCG